MKVRSSTAVHAVGDIVNLDKCLLTGKLENVTKVHEITTNTDQSNKMDHPSMRQQSEDDVISTQIPPPPTLTLQGEFFSRVQVDENIIEVNNFSNSNANNNSSGGDDDGGKSAHELSSSSSIVCKMIPKANWIKSAAPQLHLYDVTASSFNVRWLYSDPVGNFILTFIDNNSVTEHIYGGSETKVHFGGLKSGCTYKVKLIAKLKAQLSSEAELIVTTLTRDVQRNIVKQLNLKSCSDVMLL